MKRRKLKKKQLMMMMMMMGRGEIRRAQRKKDQNHLLGAI
jgi:hypothetical protein